MKDVLEKIRKIESECCVTIILNTHRNKPDIQKDVITLKNLTTQAEQKLFSMYDKRLALNLSDKLKRLADSIDHGHNLESLILFVNGEISEFVKLPIEVEDRVVIDSTFAARDLIRATQLEEAYYVLVLSRDKARLIEAYNDRAVKEVDFPFPVENTDLYLTSDKDVSKSKQKDLMIEEFFNRVDKILWSAIREKPYPVLVCTEERNFYHYLKICDNHDKIIGHLNHNRPEEKTGNIVAQAWPVIFNHLLERNIQRVHELYEAVNNGRFLIDTGEIWRALNEGRGQTLFVKEGFFQPARISNNLVEVFDGGGGIEQEDMVEDIIEKMVEVNFKNGGDVVFLPEEELRNFNGLALVTRF